MILPTNELYRPIRLRLQLRSPKAAEEQLEDFRGRLHKIHE